MLLDDIVSLSTTKPFMPGASGVNIQELEHVSNDHMALSSYKMRSLFFV